MSSTNTFFFDAVGIINLVKILYIFSKPYVVPEVLKVSFAILELLSIGKLDKFHLDEDWLCLITSN